MTGRLAEPQSRPLVLFDGVCGLCNRSVDFMMRHDRDRNLLFAPIQSPVGQDALRRGGLGADYFGSVVLLMGDRVYTHSSAALEVTRLLGWPWKGLYALVLVPRVLRDGVYRFIARHRYQWFGKRDACRLPTPAERQQLITELEPV